MKALLIQCSRILFRFSLWMPGLMVMRLLVRSLDENSIGFFYYPLLMCGDDPRAHAILAAVIRRSLDRSVDTNLFLAAMSQRVGRANLAACIYKRTIRRYSGDPGLPAAHVLLHLVQSIMNGSIYRKIAMEVESLQLQDSGDAPVLIVPLSRNYFPLFELWWQQAQEHIHGRLVVLAMDTATKDRLWTEFGCCALDISQFFFFGNNGVINRHCKESLWILRVLVLRELILRRHFVISLDLDAVVLDDLGAMLERFPPVDIVVQKDFSIPMDVARKLGFILCCGFMVFRPTDACVAFMDRYARATIRELDDQLSINHMISRAKVSNVKKERLYMRFESEGLSWLCPDDALVSRDINHGTVIRHFQQDGRSIAELRAGLGLSS